MTSLNRALLGLEEGMYGHSTGATLVGECFNEKCERLPGCANGVRPSHVSVTVVKSLERRSATDMNAKSIA